MKRIEWINLAKNRVKKVLGLRRYCSLRKLESKICEAGPSDMRPKPDIISAALNELVEEDMIFKNEEIFQDGSRILFYFPFDFDLDLPEDRLRRKRVISLYEIFLKNCRQQDYCGYVLEEIIHKAILRAELYVCCGAPRNPCRYINGFEITDDLDLILYEKSSAIRIGVEVKNAREWFYGRSQEIWECINKCLKIQAVPIFICRRLPYETRRFFGTLGVLGFENFNQYFHPDIESKMLDVKHKDGLGFADIKFSLEPEDRHIKFFVDTVHSYIEEYKKRFLNNSPILEKYALELGKDISQNRRGQLFEEFLRDIGPDNNHYWEDDNWEDY